jgi:hypothetical protein
VLSLDQFDIRILIEDGVMCRLLLELEKGVLAFWLLARVPIYLLSRT